jgi:hypothetical protein
MVNLSPPLGPGFHQQHGAIFPQPLLPDGRRLDAAIGGYRFALLSPWPIDAYVPVVPWSGNEAILLRPDRYVYGTASSVAEAKQLVEEVSREPRTAESHH